MIETVSYCYKINRFSSLLDCSTFIVCRMITFICYIGINFTFGVLFHTFYCNFLLAEEYCSLCWGLRYDNYYYRGLLNRCPTVHHSFFVYLGAERQPLGFF